MGSAVPLRSDYTAVELRQLARRCGDNRQIRRLLALAAVYDGMNHMEAARIGGMDRQTLRDWVHQFNKYGPDGLTNAKGAGRPRSLNAGQMLALAVNDDCCRENLCLVADTSISGARVARELDPLLGLYGKPACIVSDNGAI